MGRKFTSSKKNPLRAVTQRAYPKNPVGSNEWHQEKRITIMKREITEGQTRRPQVTKSQNKHTRM